jgi:hypothetical protein
MPNFPWSVKPLNHRLRARLQPEPSIAKAATEVQELCPVENDERPAALYLDGQLDRIRAIQEETTEEFERQRISAGAVTHQATIAYRFERAKLLGGVLYGGGVRHQLVYGRERLGPQRLYGTYEGLALTSSVVGSRYFGHFITDDCCTALFAQDFGQVTWVHGGHSPHAARCLEVFDLPKTVIGNAHLKNAWVFQDFGMNSHKRARFAKLREKMRGLPGKRSGHGVFVRRRGGGAERGLVNELELEEQLAKDGFEIVNPMGEALDDIIFKLRDAAVVIGVEGSALCHGLLSMADAATLVCIQPPYRFNCVLKDHADAMGMKYAFIVGEGNAEHFRVEVADILRTLELAQVQLS